MLISSYVRPRVEGFSGCRAYVFVSVPVAGADTLAKTQTWHPICFPTCSHSVAPGLASYRNTEGSGNTREAASRQSSRRNLGSFIRPTQSLANFYGHVPRRRPMTDLTPDFQSRFILGIVIGLLLGLGLWVSGRG